MTDAEVQDMFKRADTDDDGFVTFEDFYNIMTGKVYWDWVIKKFMSIQSIDNNFRSQS